MKFIRDVLIVLGIAILVASTSRSIMQTISDKRNDETSWWGTYQGRNGDLVSMAYLDFFDKFRLVRDLCIKKPSCDGEKNVDLYLSGDSYTGHFPDTAYNCLHSFHFSPRFHKDLTYALDTSKVNILLLEITERNFRDYFHGLRILEEVKKDTQVQKKMAFIASLPEHKTSYSSFFADFSIDDIFNKYINQNIQYNLFNYNFFMPVFQFKAAINYFLFHRASGDVTISKDGNFLFLKETVTPTGLGSSYSYLPEDEINNIINNLNRIYDHYKNEGFSEVYLSIIPNSATIMQPENYNNLIPKIQNNGNLKMKTIDVYSIFRNGKELYYNPGDTHWNNKGIQEWLKIVNGILVQKTVIHQ